MAAASTEKKMIVSKVLRAGTGFSRTPLSAIRCFGVLRSALSSENIALRNIVSDVKERPCCRQSCSRAKCPFFLLFEGGNLTNNTLSRVLFGLPAAQAKA